MISLIDRIGLAGNLVKHFLVSISLTWNRLLCKIMIDGKKEAITWASEDYAPMPPVPGEIQHLGTAAAFAALSKEENPGWTFGGPMTKEELDSRTLSFLSQEGDGWMYLSYACPLGFRGAAIVKGNNVVQAASCAGLLGISPGGQVAGLDIPLDILATIPESHRNRLLDKKAINEIFSDAKSIREIEAERDAEKSRLDFQETPQ